MKNARVALPVLGLALTLSGCRCSCEREEVPPVRLAEQAPADAGGLDPAQLVELVRAGKATELERLLKNRDPGAPIDWRPSLGDFSRQGDPAVWLRVYLKYHQLQAAWLYPYFDYMCPQAASRLGKDAAKLVETVAKKPSALLKKETYGLLRAPTLLHAAALLCQAPAAKVLLDAGAAVDARDSLGITPLGYASCDAVAALLLERGAKADARFERGLTPLHLAGDAAIARRLLAAGASVEARDGCGNTPLHFAAMSGRSPAEPIELQATAGADAGAPVGAELENPVLRWLLKVGIQLSEAIVRVLNELDVGSVLRAAGADPKAVNGAGRDVSAVLSELASSHGDWDD